MRVGGNPQKGEGLIELRTNHRVVVVTFIPKLEGYYKGMFEVIKLCVSSLLKTIPSTSAITIVDNASCDEVVAYFSTLFVEKKIDSLQLLSENVGKIDALMGAARSAREPIITLTDCDIIFKTGWVEETIKVFNSFKNVGSVSPYPSRRSLRYYTFSFQWAVLRNKIKLTFKPKPEIFKDYNVFLESINWEPEIDNNALWPIIAANDCEAVVGSDHQVLTLRRDILFNTSPAIPSFTKVGKESERDYVDLAVDLSGGLRLSLSSYFAQHMGNRVEPWMIETVKSAKKKTETTIIKLNPPLFYKAQGKTSYKIKKKIAKAFFNSKVSKNYL